MKKNKVIKIILLIIIIIFAAICYKGWSIYNKIDKMTDSKTQGYNDKFGGLKKPKSNELVFLLAGRDQNKGKTKEEINSNTRTDTIMVIKINTSTGNIDILNIPRDSRVKIKDQYHKINAAHSYGGNQLMLDTINNTFHIKLNYYMVIDFDFIGRLVDAIGGVEVDSPVEINEPSINVYIPKGKSKIDGKSATYFVRYRKELNGDMGRIANQHKFLKSLFKQLFNIKNVTKVDKFMYIYENNVETNIPANELMKLALNAYKFKSDELKMYTIPGDYLNEVSGNGRISFFIPNRIKTGQLLDELFKDYRFGNMDNQEENIK